MSGSSDDKRSRTSCAGQVLVAAWLTLASVTGPGDATGAEPSRPTGPRFTLALGGAAVEDQQTGLIWEQEPDAFHGTWTQAAAHCREKSVAGQTGWRIPSVSELSTLTDPTQYDPALPPGHPFSNVKSAIYWTATPSATDDMVAWHVSFFTGEKVTDQKSQTRRAWCVREGPRPGAR